MWYISGMATPIFNTTQFQQYISDLFWEQWETYIDANPSNTLFPDKDWRFKTFTVEVNSEYEDNFFTREFEARDREDAFTQLYLSMHGTPEMAQYVILGYNARQVVPGSSSRWYYVFSLRWAFDNPLFEPKYIIRFDRLWGTESTIPEGEIEINDDIALHSYITNNVPSFDMDKTIEYLSLIVATQLRYMLQDEKYENVGPVYAESYRATLFTGSLGGSVYLGERFRLFPYDPETATEPEIPILHLQEPNDLVADVQSLYFWNTWVNPNAATSVWLRSRGYDGDVRSHALAKLVNAWTTNGGVFCELEDPNGFIKDAAALNWMPAHKVQRVLHDFATDWQYDRIDDPGNTFEVIHYPKEDILGVNVVDIGSNTTFPSTHVSQRQFKISDTCLKIASKNVDMSEITTDEFIRTYRGTFDKVVLFVNDNNFVVADVVITDYIDLPVGRIASNWAIRYTPSANFSIEPGDEVDIFTYVDESPANVTVKNVYFDVIAPTTWDASHALAQGSNILPILGYGKRNHAIVDEPYTGYYASVIDKNNVLDKGPATIIRYHSVSVPGTLVDTTPLLDVAVTLDNNTYTPTNTRVDYTYRDYFGFQVPPGDHWAKDMSLAYMNVLHKLIDNWVVKCKLEFDEFNVISQHDRDWGVAKPRVSVEQIKM